MVGAPCSQSEVLPYPHPSMALTRTAKHDHRGSKGIRRAVFGTCGYDGSVSFNLLYSQSQKTDVAASFIAHTRAKMSREDAKALLDLYHFKHGDKDEDEEALRKVCLFESDSGSGSSMLRSRRSRGVGVVRIGSGGGVWSEESVWEGGDRWEDGEGERK
jgi:hypothetical protein